MAAIEPRTTIAQDNSDAAKVGYLTAQVSELQTRCIRLECVLAERLEDIIKLTKSSVQSEKQIDTLKSVLKEYTTWAENYITYGKWSNTHSELRKLLEYTTIILNEVSE